MKTAGLVAGVVAAHAVFFYFFAGFKPLPERPYIPPPNFKWGAAEISDPHTHEKMVYHEFTVSSHVETASAGGPPPASIPQTP